MTEENNENSLALLNACKRTDEKEALRIIDNEQFDPRLQDSDGNTAFYYAVQKGLVNVVEKLFHEDRRLISFTNKTGQAPLHLMILLKNNKYVDLLLERHFLLDLLSKYPGPNNYSGTILHYAVKYNNIYMLKALSPEFHYYYDNSLDSNGYSPLRIASEIGNVESLNLLLELARNSIHDNENVSALFFSAASNNHTECVKSLIRFYYRKYNYLKSPFLKALLDDNVNEFKTILTSDKIDINRTYLDGWTLLHIAACVHSTAIVRELLSMDNLNVNIRDVNFYAPLHYMARQGTLSILNMIINRADVDVNINNYSNHTPLHWAAIKNHTDCVKALLSRTDIDINKRGHYGRPALTSAIISNSLNAIDELLKDITIQVNIKCNSDMTPLYYAVRLNHFDCLKAL